MNTEFPLQPLCHGTGLAAKIGLDLGVVLFFDAVLQNQGDSQEHQENQCRKCRVQQSPHEQG